MIRATNLLVPAFAAAIFAVTPPCAYADPDDSLLTTYSQYGSRLIDIGYGTQKVPGQFPASAATFGVGDGIEEYWYSEFYLSYTHDSGGATTFDSAALQNIFDLTRGALPVDIGLYTEIEYERDRTQGYQASFGPLFQTEFGLTTANLNFLLQRNYRADAYNAMQLGYQWQIKERISASYEFGVQGFGELGQWNHWAPRDQQEHRLGPVILGKLALDDGRVIHYNVALLFDAFDRQNALTLRAQAVIGF